MSNDEMPSEQETMQLYGINKDGIQEYMGEVPLSPEMKMREIPNGYFTGNIDDEDDDAAWCYYALKDFYSWLKKNGHLKEKV